MNEAATVDPDSPATAEPAAAAAPTTDSVQGRSAFRVEVSGAGLVVHTVFAADDGRVLPLPAVFPDVHYALEQIDGLRRLVVERFTQAAQVGAQLIAAQRARAVDTAAPQPPAVADERAAEPSAAA